MIVAAGEWNMANLIVLLTVSAWKSHVLLTRACHMLHLTFKGSGSISVRDCLLDIFPEMYVFPYPKSQ